MRARIIVAVLASAALLGCDPEPRRGAPAPRRELRWYRDLRIDAAGGDWPAMIADPGGGLWVAVTGLADASGKSRLFHRPAGGAWRTRYEGPFATEPSLSSLRAGEVYFGANRPLDAFRPTLLLVSEDAVTEVPAPAERLDGLEHLQIGGYAMLSRRDGFACAQRGRMFRWDGERWIEKDPALPWQPGDPAAKSFCRSIQLENDHRGFLTDASGAGAVWDGARWREIPREGAFAFVSPASGLSRDGSAFARWDGGFHPLAGQIASQALVFDPTGRWAAYEGGVVSLGTTSVRALLGSLPTTPRAIAEADGDLWAIGADGVYRSTRRAVPTFTDAGPGGPPPGLFYAIAVDLDQDGDEDLLGLRAPPDALYGAPAPLVAAINQGRGRFVMESLGLPDDVHLWRDRFDVGDVDGDGDLDVVTISAGGRVDVLRAQRGRFTRAFSRDVPGATVALVDVDGDGDLDLSLLPARPAILLNDGAGRFVDGPEVPVPASPIEHAEWADVDGDGDADAILQHWRDPAHLLRNTGKGFELVDLGVVAEGVAIADVDRDGAPEILAQKIHVRGVALPFARCKMEGSICAPIEGPNVPAGLVVDLDRDGTDEVIASDLRGDEAMEGEGEVWHVARGGGFERITEVTGSMPRPAAIDADGDGDPDVYSPSIGLRVNTSDAITFLRVRLRASASDRLARGAFVIARRAGGGPIVASGRALYGAITLGLPDPDARYDLEVRFPGGRRRVVAELAAGTEVTVRDREMPPFLARLALLWANGTWLRVSPLRDLAPALALAAAWIVVLRRNPKRLGPRVALPLFGASWLALAGLLLRAGGAVPWMLTPLAALVAAGGQGLALLHAQRRSARAAGPYVLEAKLGAGASATVWRARAGKTRVALKLFSAESMGSREARERFFREARVGSEIKHPNVVRIHDSGELEDGRCYLAMELVEGRSLGDLIRERGRLPAGTVASIGVDVARALAALHDAEIVHRDVKPENILVRPDGTAVLTDLGLARSALFRTLTRHDVAVGTLAYMSPEQCVGRPLDGRSDAWSLGVTLYEALTGRRAFDAAHELELVYVIHNVDPTPPSDLVPDVPPALEAAILKCLDREPAARFASARDVEAVLAPLASTVIAPAASGTIQKRPGAKIA